MPRATRLYRITVFALAAFYFLDRAITEHYQGVDGFGWQFRYLTIWALTGSLIAAAAMLVPAFGRPGPRWSIFVSVMAVVNALVVGLFWRIHLQDPAAIYGPLEVPWWRDWYLHGLGPVLQWIDVIFLKRGFRAPLRVALWLAVFIAAYIGWAELVVAPLSDVPAGTVTTGLPYPFLNDMELGARFGFYFRAYLGGLVLIVLFRAAQGLADRLRSLRPA